MTLAAALVLSTLTFSPPAVEPVQVPAHVERVGIERPPIEGLVAQHPREVVKVIWEQYLEELERQASDSEVGE